MLKRTARLVIAAAGLFCWLAVTVPAATQDQAAAQPAVARPAIAQPAIAQPAMAMPVMAPAPTDQATAPQPVIPQVVKPATGQVRPAVPAQPTPPARVVEPMPEGQVDRAPSPRPPGFAEAANVKIEVTISYQVGNAAPVKRSAMLTVADQESGSLRAGNQIAVPSTTFTPVAKPEAVSASATPAPAPVTSFNYRSVGVNLDARRVFVSGNRAKLTLSVEFSAVDDKTADASRPPSLPTFSQSFTLVTESGKPIVVAQSSDIVDGVERKQSVEVKATILR